jgi:hypothetical protein
MAPPNVANRISLVVLISDIEFELYTSSSVLIIAWFLGHGWRRESPELEGSCKYVE